MKKLRKCTNGLLYTGNSKCPPDFGNMKGAILVEPGTKLPSDLDAETLEKLVHADRPERVYGIMEFVEYAKDGGEVQTSAEGYGGEKRTGLSARKDTYTMESFNPELYASLLKCVKKWDVYFFDENNHLYGIDDGTDVLAGYSMNDIYANANETKTSSTQSSMTVVFSHANAKKSAVGFDFVELDFDPMRLILGLVPVKLRQTESANEFKLYESKGSLDLTSEYGPLIAEASAAVLSGTTSAVSYNKEKDVLIITATDNVSLKEPSVLYEHGIKGIEQI